MPLTCLLATGFLIGVSTNLAKMAAEVGLGAVPYLTWSVVGAAFVLSVLQAANRRLPPINARTTEYFFVSALVGIALPNLVLFAAVPRVGAGFVAFSVAFPPLYTYVGALLLRMERFDPRRALGVALALGGASLLSVLKLTAPDAPTGWVVATLAAPMVIATGNLYRTWRWPKAAGPDQLAPGVLGACGLMLLAGAVAGPSLAVPMASAAPMLLILVQTLVFSAQHPLFFVLQKRGGPVYLSLVGSVAAAVGMPMAVLLLGEPPPEGILAAAPLIAFGIYFVARGGVGQPG